LVPEREKCLSSSSPSAGGARVEYETDELSDAPGDAIDAPETEDGNDDLRFFKHSLSFLKNDSVYAEEEREEQSQSSKAFLPTSHRETWRYLQEGERRG
jgi:hypothetical protein